jgi:hypothetical protein
MEKLILSIADLSIGVCLEEDLEFLIKPFTVIFDGFLGKTGKSKAILNVSYDYFNTCPEFGDVPVELRQIDLPECTEFVNIVGSVYQLSKHSVVIGYLNGCLAYNFNSRTGHVIFFRSKQSDMIMGSFLKLLFVFVSLIASEENKFMVHGAGIDGEGRGYLFLGQSGAGKTTVAGFARKEDILSDDSPVLGSVNGKFYIYSSPFSQVNLFDKKSKNHCRKRVQLNKLFFLMKGEELSVKKRERRSALAEIVMKHIHGFEFMDKNCRITAFSFCSDLCGSIPAYDLHFQKNGKYWDALASIEDSRIARP